MLTRLTGFIMLLLVTGTPVAAQLAPVNVERVVLSEARTRVAFLVAAEPDCSPIELTVRIFKKPVNGKLELEEGDGFGAWRKEDPRSTCNDKKTWGWLLFYSSNPGFKGIDRAEIEVFSDRGASRRTRISITVK